jgi:D-glycero-D-manno-heptose 1,7-bisphosphate phosphatase
LIVYLVVLGRDGVINHEREGGVLNVDLWEAIPGSAEAIARLCRAGCRVVIATNQQQLSSGELNVEALHDIHARMIAVVQEAGGSIDSIFFAATGDPDGHGRKQPKLALLEQISERYGVATRDMVMVGDSREDLEAAKSAGAKAVLVRTGHGRNMLGELADFDGVTIYADLAAAVDAMVSQTNS